MRLLQIGTVRLVRQWQAEEPGETDRLDPGALRLEGAAEDLGAHVDAERGLNGGTGVRPLRRSKRAGKLALIGPLRRVLQDHIHNLIGGRRDGVGMGHDRLLPAFGHLGNCASSAASQISRIASRSVRVSSVPS